ncbi:MAG: thymidylate kinase [Arenicella sp.]|jgi:thymidylate kinase
MFKQKYIKYSDLELLTKIFTGVKATIYVFDPEGKVIYDVDETYEVDSSSPKVLFNFGKDLLRFKEFELTDFDQVFDFGSISRIATAYEFKLRLVQNKFNELKWIFSPNDKFQSYLNFFNTKSFKAKLIKTAIKLCAKLKLNSLFSQSFYLYSNSEIHCEKMYKNDSADNYSIYCGSPGILRKPVIQYTSGGHALAFVKFAISNSSLTQIERERAILRKLTSNPINGISIPHILKSDSELALATSPVIEQTSGRIILKSSIYRAIKAMAVTNVRFQKLSFLPHLGEIKNQISLLKNKGEQYNVLQTKLKKIEAKIDTNQYIYTSLSHGDFSPWNFKNGTVLGVYDWEMADNERPVLHDFFHYIMMDEILVKRELDGAQIIKKIRIEAEQPKIKYLIKHFRIHFNTHLQLYLLHNISAQLVRMSETNKLSADHLQLIKGWNSVLNELILNVNFKDQRETILCQFEKFMISTPYVAMKFIHKRFSELSIGSDLDLATHKREVDGISKFFKLSMLVDDLKVKSLGHMTVLKIFLKNGQFLSVDLIHKFSRKGILYLNADQLISGWKQEGMVKKPSATFELLNILSFYLLNKSDVPQKYVKLMSSIFNRPFLEDKAIVSASLYLGIEEGDFSELFKYTPSKRRLMIKHIKVYQNFLVTQRIFRVCRYYLVQCKNLIVPQGSIITFSGVDGAGKTTVINEVIESLKNKYRKEVVYLRHRPGLLPILSAVKHGSRAEAEKISSQNLPRQGKNKNKISSILRFSYYYADYILGQIMVRVKYLSRDKIVIYDRYYFDFINDSKRSNICLKRSFIKRMYTFISKPDFNFYLYNDPKVILQRKKELSKKDIVELNTNYRMLFKEYSESRIKGEYIQLKNDKLSETIDVVMSQLKNIA